MAVQKSQRSFNKKRLRKIILFKKNFIKITKNSHKFKKILIKNLKKLI